MDRLIKICRTRDILAFLITLAFFSIIALLCFKDIPDGNENIVNIAFGALTSSFCQMVGYYWSKEKALNDSKITTGDN